MEARAVQQEVLDGFLCVPAPGAVGVGGQAQAVEMSSELGVSQTEVGEGHVVCLHLAPQKHIVPHMAARLLFFITSTNNLLYNIDFTVLLKY